MAMLIREDPVQVVHDAVERARRPVAVPWWAAVEGFLAGFLVAMLPAAIVTRITASQLPFVSAVLHGPPALLFAFVTCCAAGLATAVCATARAMRG